MNSHQNPPHTPKQQVEDALEGLCSPSSANRITAAQELQELAASMDPAQRPPVMAALAQMLESASEYTEVVFGLHCLSVVASGQMPDYSEEEIYSKATAAEKVVTVCGHILRVLDNSKETQLISLGAKSLSRIFKTSGKEERNSFLFRVLSGSKLEKMVALTSIHSMDYRDDAVSTKVAFCTQDWDHEVCTRAEEVFRKISQHTEDKGRLIKHPLRELVLEENEEKLPRHIKKYFKRNGKDSNAAELLKAFAITGFVRGLENGTTIAKELARMGHISDSDIDRHGKNAKKGGSNHPSRPNPDKQLDRLRSLASSKATFSVRRSLPRRSSLSPPRGRGPKPQKKIEFTSWTLAGRTAN
ncbi:hypothetical protein GF415_04390 [Candidatus Micrarchaeota archaeon]|nr:hypothetical protein [Candidatus Micrarchaeota archaeon]